MQRIHSTSSHPQTYVRIFVLVVLSVLFTISIRASVDADMVTFFTNNVFNLGILYAIIVGFLLQLTLTRRYTLESYISLELNKIRRMYHLVHHIALANPQLKPWSEKMIASLQDYCKYFTNHSFTQYADSNLLFRKVTYTIYGLPALKFSYNPELYYNLVETASGATESREMIRSLKDNFIGRFQWITIIFITITLSYVLVLSSPLDYFARFITFLVIFILFFVVLLTYEYDRFNSKKNQFLAFQYANNLSFIPKEPVKRGKSSSKKAAF